MPDKLDKPGRFVSDLDGYPGHFQLPHPFLDRHMRVWWTHAVEELKEVTRADYEFYDGEWNGVVELITQFGAWDIENVPPGDLTTDGVPMVVKSWVLEKANEYITPFLTPRMRLLASGIL